MKNKNLVLAIATSTYSPSFYREVCQRWRGRAFAYLLVLLAVCWVFISFSKTLDFCLMLDKVGAVAAEQMPVIHADKGVLTGKMKEPTFLRWKQNSLPFAVIDLNRQFRSFKNSSVQILVRPKYIVVKKSHNQVSTYYFPKTLSGTIGPNTIRNFLMNRGKSVLAVTFFAVFVVGVVFYYVWYVVLSLIYALLGMIFVAFMKAKVNYGSMIRIALVALTPAILLQSLFIVSGVSFDFQYLVYFFITIIYLFFAVRANRTLI